MGNNYNFTEERNLKVEKRFKAKEDAKASVFSRINNQNVQVKLIQFRREQHRKVQANKSVR